MTKDSDRIKEKVGHEHDVVGAIDMLISDLRGLRRLKAAEMKPVRQDIGREICVLVEGVPVWIQGSMAESLLVRASKEASERVNRSGKVLQSFQS